jgi:hypothetical protein
MKYEQFEDLPVWQAAIELARQVYQLTENPAFKSRYSLRDQIERAAVSVSNNLAEGFERGTNQELLTFLIYCAGVGRGSALHAPPAARNAGLPGSAIPNRGFAAQDGEHFAATGRVDSLAARLGTERGALRERENPAG